MRTLHDYLHRARPNLPLLLLAGLFVVLLIAGGASREDALGQTLVRAVSWGALIALLMVGKPITLGKNAPIFLILLAALLLALLQLIPLPPGVWQALPGRQIFAEAMGASGQNAPWRPLTISPSATVNAASSLIVPLVALILASALGENERRWLPGILLAIIAVSTFVGLLQFSGAGIDNPLINDIGGEISGTFANRNHFALFLAFGCMVAPVWAFLDGRPPTWRGPVALGLVLLFVLMILATGSRAGLVLGLLSLCIGLMLVQKDIRRITSRYSRWVFPALIAGMLALVAVLVVLSFSENRAVSIDRIFSVDAGQDMRSRGLPTVTAMVREYLPLGSGLGGFNATFRMHEPFDLLKPTYFNHAHNDLLEVLLDAGIPGALLLFAAICWWAWTSFHAWRAGSSARHALPKLGSAILLLIIIASAADYPARTPMIMAAAIIAAIWLSDHARERRRPALPNTHQHL